MPLEIAIASDVAAFQAVLLRYIQLTGKLPAEVVRQKAIAIGFQLYRAFRVHQWGGDPKKKGIARAEFDARVAQGRGIRLRPSIRRSMNARALELGSRLTNIMLRGKLGRARKTDAAARERYRGEFRQRWREAVRRELSVRERGIGYMASSLIVFRRFKRVSRYDTAPVSQASTDRRGRLVGSFTAGEDSARILAQVPGIELVGARYDLVGAAIQAERADTLEYLRRRFRDMLDESKGANTSGASVA